jgi:prepilin signal peptidase PulO-like enzyme (type II secretory pathway)
MEIVVSAVAGLLVAGLINMLADDLPARQGLHRPACPACGAPRPPRAWLALAALLGGRWRCPYCQHPIRVRAILVELLMTGVGAWLAAGGGGPWEFGPGLLLAAIFLLITVIDIEHRLILHVVSLPSIVVIGLVGIADPARGASKTLLGGLAGFGIVLVLYLFGWAYGAWAARRRGQPIREVAFGFGDVTLATIIGLAVGWPGIILALMIGVLSAGLFSLASVAWMLLRRRYQPYMPFPYGPFLILGGVLVYFGGRQLFQSALLAG